MQVLDVQPMKSQSSSPCSRFLVVAVELRPLPFSPSTILSGLIADLTRSNQGINRPSRVRPRSTPLFSHLTHVKTALPMHWRVVYCHRGRHSIWPRLLVVGRAQHPTAALKTNQAGSEAMAEHCLCGLRFVCRV